MSLPESNLIVEAEIILFVSVFKNNIKLMTGAHSVGKRFLINHAKQTFIDILR